MSVDWAKEIHPSKPFKTLGKTHFWAEQKEPVYTGFRKTFKTLGKSIGWRRPLVAGDEDTLDGRASTLWGTTENPCVFDGVDVCRVDPGVGT